MGAKEALFEVKPSCRCEVATFNCLQGREWRERGSGRALAACALHHSQRVEAKILRGRCESCARTRQRACVYAAKSVVRPRARNRYVGGRSHTRTVFAPFPLSPLSLSPLSFSLFAVCSALRLSVREVPIDSQQHSLLHSKQPKARYHNLVVVLARNLFALVLGICVSCARFHSAMRAVLT